MAKLTLLLLMSGALAFGAPSSRGGVADSLSDIVEGRRDGADLSVTYDDMHGLYGGLTLTIHGDGRVEQKAVRVKAGTPRKVPKADIVRLVKSLLEHAAWEQRVPERSPVPDESRARLLIKVGVQSSEIWEWHNDLEKNARLARIRGLMQSLAWAGRRPAKKKGRR